MSSLSPEQRRAVARAVARVAQAQMERRRAWDAYLRAVERQGNAHARGSQPAVLMRTMRDAHKAEQAHRRAQGRVRKAETHARRLGGIS